MKGKVVEFSVNGTTSSGYLSLPSSGNGNAIIVLQEWWGLVEHIKDVADRFANEGYVTLAPDLYHGEATSNPSDAQKLAMALSIDTVEKDLKGAIDYLLALEETTGRKVGIVGFCMGGALSLYAACVNDKIGACVIYYGIHPEVKNKIVNLQSPVLGFFGELDQGVSPERVKALEEELTTAGREHEFFIYPDANHAFFNDTRPAYNPEASKDSWAKMLKFYKNNL